MRITTTRLALFAVAVLVLFPTVRAQSGGAPLAIGSERLPIRVEAAGLYQQFETEGATVMETTTPLAISAPLARGVVFTLRASYATVSGEPSAAGTATPAEASLATVSGLADAQLGLSYYRPVGAGSIAASVTVNVPSGPTALSAPEARTAFLLGQGFYGFRLPVLGQGPNVAPALTWAFPIGDRFAGGIGVAYQVRGAFEPRAGTSGAEAVAYDPGDELLLTAGLDYRAAVGRFSLDGTYAHYGTDTFGALSFETGNALTLTAQWAGRVGRHDARALVRFRSKGESAYPEEDGFVVTSDAVVPTSGRIRGQVEFRMGSRWRVGTLAQGRYYAASDLFAPKTAFDVSIAPAYEVSRSLALTLRVGGTAGDISGFTAGGGVVWEM